MTTLIIARHGNTFNPTDIVTYVGARTDIPLSASGQAQARALGDHLRQQGLIPDTIFTSTLKRTRETAALAFPDIVATPLPVFNEIDYGPDENKTREDIIVRIGKKALQEWEDHNVVPPGWQIDTNTIIGNWKNFATQNIRNKKFVLVVTSNGIARFAPHITGDYESFRRSFNPKLATGAYGILVPDGDQWHVRDWNKRP
ncbi:MAG: histidine phosphatase family protein [Alphaproteobacteria bacterium]|nr:histidine phosphatase family protein [Alphaproteobacteria bacterium]